jgi:predicted ATPase
VTFLFTDIEGSTRRWEDNPEEMRADLVAHDEVLAGVVEAHNGWLFKHTGDGVCAAFGSARAAIDAAVDAQQFLRLPVRMGVATGEAERRGDDYFGPVLNRTSRVMAAGHGGQILVAASTTAVVSGVDLLDRGAHRLRDLSGVEHLFQVRAAGLRVEFPPLRTLDAVPGNLPVQTTSFVGREIAVKELAEQVRAHRLVTLTGVGGVGKTRLAVQVAAELTGEFGDGVWLVELAPLVDPAAVPDAVAAVLGVTPQAGLSVTGSITQAMSGRRLLLVLDNCEHVLDAAAEFAEQLLAHTSTVRVLVTSREGLRVGAEHLWPVPSLDVGDGAGSAAVTLFVDRAQAVNPTFVAEDDSGSAAVIEVCRRLDGIALAIELAAARMVSMSVSEVLARLSDRFRLLSGSRRGLERHQTLRQAIQWSYDLLGDDELVVLQQCAVFAGGFDLDAATQVCEHFDEFAVLDVLDSLVRKSLVSVEHVQGHSRYGMLETIRQFAGEQLAATGNGGEVRDRHAAYYADQAASRWAVWDGPGYRAATEWVEDEFSNLRAGFRWAADQADVVTAATIAAHTTMLTAFLQLHESAGWAEEILDVATANDIAQLPLLYTAASLCSLTGRPDAGVAYASAAVALTADSRYETSDAAWIRFMEGSAHRYAGRPERYVAICTELAARPGAAHVIGLCGLLAVSPEVGRSDEARAIADQTLAAAHAHGNPVWIALALTGSGRAFAGTDPHRALSALRQGLVYAREHQLPYFEALLAREAAVLETVSGPLEQALTLFDTAIDLFHRAGLVVWVVTILADLAVLFDRVERPEVAATCYGAATNQGGAHQVPNLPAAVDRLRAGLGEEAFDRRVAAGEAMKLADAVRYAREQIQAARRQIAGVT